MRAAAGGGPASFRALIKPALFDARRHHAALQERTRAAFPGLWAATPGAADAAEEPAMLRSIGTVDHLNSDFCPKG